MLDNKLLTKMKRRIEFSKILVIIAITIFASYGIYSGMRYYSLVLLAIESDNLSMATPDPALAVTCVGGILGSILTYVLYLASLKWSLNANNLLLDLTTGIVKKIVEGDTLGLIETIVKADVNEEPKKSNEKDTIDVAG